MGPAGDQRSGFVRADDPRSFPVRPFMDHDFAQAGEFPGSVRRFSSRACGGVRSGRHRAAEGRRWIVRNLAKIKAAISNARIVAELGESFVDLVWSYHDQRSRPCILSDVPSTSPASIALSRELRRRGIQFLGPTTAYAMMQAIGLLDDHLKDCFVPVPRLPRRASDTE